MTRDSISAREMIIGVKILFWAPGIPGDAFQGAFRGPALAQRAAECGKADGQTGGQSDGFP